MTETTPPRNAPKAAAWADEPFMRLVDSIADYAIFLLDTGGHVTTWNRGAERIKGYKPREIIGKHFSIFYPREAIDRRWPEHEIETAKRIGRFEDEGWRLRKDGSRFWASVIINAIRNEDGQLLGFSKITRDLTERREYEERLRLSEERFRLLLEGIQDYAIFMLDTEGRITSWSAGAQNIFGYQAHEVIGQTFERFFPPEDAAAGRAAEELRRALLHRRSEMQGWRMRKDGSRFWAEVIVTSLHDAEGRLRGFAMVTRDLSDRKRMESLEEQGRHLTEFLAMLAHELRNPLAPIRNALGIMRMQKQLPPQAAWARDVIDRQTGQLARLVDDLLDVSRITRGKLRLQAAPMDICAAAQRAVETSRPLIDARHHTLHVDLPEEPLIVHGDVTRLTQVILNLLNNAAKYTPEGGQIWLEVAERGDDAVVRVRDTGMGIAPEMIDRVFDLFAQGERAIDRSEGGLGIGLTLARRIVALHGGRVVAKSAGIGKGAEFVVTLPRVNLASSVGGPAAEDFTPAPAARKRSILVVDDNPDAAESMAMLLRMVGHEVDIEHDGAAALKRAAEHPPEIVLLDIGLPGMSGYDVAKQMRAHAHGARMRILALTGYGGEEDRRRSLESGFDGHLVKPVLPTELFNAISEPVTAPSP